MSLYAADGSFNVTEVAGNVITGLYAEDGSYNVVTVDGTALVADHAPCGALNIIEYVSGQPSARAACGARMYSVDPYVEGTMKVTFTT